MVLTSSYEPREGTKNRVPTRAPETGIPNENFVNRSVSHMDMKPGRNALWCVEVLPFLRLLKLLAQHFVFFALIFERRGPHTALRRLVPIHDNNRLPIHEILAWNLPDTVFFTSAPIALQRQVRYKRG